MQVLFSTLAEAEEQQPYLRDVAVQRGTRCLAEYQLGSYGRAWNRYGHYGRGWRTESLLPFSLLWTLVSFLLLPLSGSLISLPCPKKGKSKGNSSPLTFKRSLSRTTVHDARWNNPPFPSPSGQVLGSGQGGCLGCGHVHRFWPFGHRPSTVPAQPG